MSLGLVVKGPEGLVLAAESRVTLTATTAQGPLLVHYDNATKLFGFEPPHSYVGVVTYGAAAIGERTAYGFLPEFESVLGEDRMSVSEYASAVQKFYLGQWQLSMPKEYSGQPMVFLVAGFDDGEPYGRVYEVVIPGGAEPKLISEQANFGITWGGQTEIADRIIRGYDARLPPMLVEQLHLTPTQQESLNTALSGFQMPVPFNVLSLQDCVDLSILFFRTTTAVQHLTVGIRGVGGATDIATITRRDGFKFIQRKAIRGEQGG
jgi:hypothetical protein